MLRKNRKEAIIHIGQTLYKSLELLKEDFNIHIEDFINIHNVTRKDVIKIRSMGFKIKKGFNMDNTSADCDSCHTGKIIYNGFEIGTMYKDIHAKKLPKRNWFEQFELAE